MSTHLEFLYPVAAAMLLVKHNKAVKMKCMMN